MKKKKNLLLALLCCAGVTVSAQSYSLRTNVLGLATTNLNVEASMTLSRKWSFHLPVQYNPFKFSENRQFRNFYVAPGVRYWLLQSYIGGFVGVYGTAGTYSVGNLFGSKYRYEGESYGVSISIGRAYQLSKSWNFEWEIGAGALWMDYDKYLCKRCGDLVSRKHEWAFLPTRAALNIYFKPSDMKKRTIIPLLLTGIIVSCGTKKPLERVRISNPNMEKRANRIDTASVPQTIKWTDDKGKTRIITRSEHDSISGEDITTVQLAEITVTARSKQIAERNGKINLDFLVTVPGSLINNKWQLQLTPVAYKPNDTLYLDKIFLSGADFAKMQKKGYLQYQAFLASIIPDSLYLQEMFNQKGYKKAMAELENEYFQAWKNEVIQKERWIDWSDRLNARFRHFNFKVDQNRAAIQGYNSILEYFPAYSMHRQLDATNVPSKWKMFVDGNHTIRTKQLTPEDSVEITKRFTNYKKIAENQRKKEMKDEMYDKYVRFPLQAARLDTIIKEGSKFVYYYKQELPVTEQLKRIDLTLNGVILAKDESITPLPPSDTISYFISSMVQFLDREPRYKKKIITRKDEVNVTAYINYQTASTTFDERIGKNKEELERVFETIRNINYTGEFLIDSIYMTATSSPEGSASLNMQLSKGRALNLKQYLLRESDDREGVDSLFRPQWIGEDWGKLRKLIAADDSLPNRAEMIIMCENVNNPDRREEALRTYPEGYKRMRDKYYPLLRAVEFKFHLHRRGMIQDTIIMPVIDSTYQDAIRMIENRQYKKALVVLDDQYPDDYNTAICLMSLGYDRRALEIMNRQADTSNRNYILAILYYRLKDETEAVKHFVKACEQDETKIWRGKLDPEINTLIKTYNLYKDELE